MDKQEVIKILEQYNKWRRGDEDTDILNPTEIGKAIDYAIKYLKDKE